MQNAAPPAIDRVTLAVTRQQSQLVVQGLRMLLNCRQFQFKESDDNVRQMHSELFEAYEEIDAQVRQNLEES